MSDNPHREQVPITCTTCDQQMKVTLDDVAKQRTVHCPEGHAVPLKDEGGKVRQVLKSYDDLMKKFR